MSEDYVEGSVIRITDDNNPLHALQTILKDRKGQAATVLDVIYETAVKYGAVATQAAQSVDKGIRYVVDMDNDTKNKIEAGLIKLVVGKDGSTYAQIRQADGKFGKRFSIKKELTRKGINPTEMASALQAAAVQDQLEELSQNLLLVDERVRGIEKGMQNDRIGLYQSGYQLLLEASRVQSETFRQSLLSQALKSLSDGMFQMRLQFQEDIRFLLAKDYKKLKGKQTEEIDSRIQSINQAYVVIYKAAVLRAAIYSYQGEYEAMCFALQDFQSFIKNLVEPSAALLREYDQNDKSIGNSTWLNRAKLDVGSIAEKLEGANGTWYLGLEAPESSEEEDNENEA